MEFADRLRELAARIPAQLEHIRTEEACKNALIMPFINCLGYNVFDPREVTPELIADVGTKKGEKVDYAILKDGKPIILFECKAPDANLDTAHASQLYRYFSVTDAKFSVLTNGLVFKFFSDLDAPNRMDAKPFLEVDMRSLDELVIQELAKFSKASFDVNAILATASELKFTKEIKRIFAQEMQSPSEELVRFFVGRVHEGRVTQSIRDQFRELVKRALQQTVSERVSDRLKSALAEEVQTLKVSSPASNEAQANLDDQKIETTQLEIDGFNVVRAIVSATIDPRRVALRDGQSYCAVLIDDNNRKPVCRLWFNGSKKYIGLFDDNKAEVRVPVDDPVDIYKHAEHLRLTTKRYLPQSSTSEAESGGSSDPKSH